MNGADAFEALEMRVGRIRRAERHPKTRKPSYMLWIDFGPYGERTSSAQLTDLYRPEDLVGRQVIAAVNLGSRWIAGFESQVLVLGAPDPGQRVVLLGLDRDVPEGSRIF
ncbi:MAG TPA: tRNA-binding protein [bacterium]|nr:tRNA-binding protein [bacterium]